MSCCNKSKCDNKKPAPAPTEELGLAELNGFGAWVIDKLFTVLQTGRITVDLQNEAAKRLAAAIANLIDENNYLRAVLRVFSPTAAVTGDEFSIKFGPGQQYQLHIPVATEADRQQLIDTLEAAVVELKKRNAPTHPAQQLLFETRRIV